MSFSTNSLLNKHRFRKIILVITLITLGTSLIMPVLESASPDSQIHSLLDSLWWAVSTITTIGYGDYVPVTVAGKILGLFLQIIGSTLYGVIFVVIGSTFTQSQDVYKITKLNDRLEHLEAKIDHLLKSNSLLLDHRKKPRRK